MSNARLATGFFVGGLVLLALSLLAGPVLPAQDASEPTIAPAVSLVDQGRALFQAKACASCHEPGLHGAPNLRAYDPEPAFLRQWLRDPEAVRPGTAMPDLNLDEAEIEALIAFLLVHDGKEQPGRTPTAIP